MKLRKPVIIFLVLMVLTLGFYFILSNMFVKDEEGNRKIKGSVKYEEYKAGDLVEFYDDSWYVMYDSDEKSDYVTLFSSKISFFEEIPTVIDGIYETSDINKFLKNTLAERYGKENLVEKNGYSVRLFNEDDMKELMEVEYDKKTDSYEIKECPNYICLNFTFFATMIDTNRRYEQVDVYNKLDDINYSEDYLFHLKYYNIVGDDNKYKLESVVNDTTLFVIPVINVLKTSLIEKDIYEYEKIGE